MKTTTVINGFAITESVAEVLESWNDSEATVRYAQYLSDIQDLLCRIMVAGDEYDDQIKESLIALICIKDDFNKMTKTVTNGRASV